VKRIVATTQRDNEGSLAVLHRAGFRILSTTDEGHLQLERTT
jgi:RimJ/RimL family protein N-acetyltransferase